MNCTRPIRKNERTSLKLSAKRSPQAVSTWRSLQRRFTCPSMKQSPTRWSTAADRDHMQISISDQGKGFDTRIIKAALKKRDVLSNRGRGIYIINQFSKISWNEKGNQIVLLINRKK
jgi:hypothetical protein